MEKRQTSIAGKTTGSFINYLMGNNTTLPEVGKGATILLWTDRHAYEVMSIEGDKVTLQQYLPERIDSNGMSETQKYKYEKLSGKEKIIVWRKNGWFELIETIVFTPEYSKYVEQNRKDYYKSGAYKQLYNPETNSLILVKGKTKIKRTYSKINIIFGVKEEYYDYSF